LIFPGKGNSTKPMEKQLNLDNLTKTKIHYGLKPK